ncbi:hypothetical protein EO98_19315 [Methanosarcina sp. 2.H.T.1A.6]|nr:hypothetical protein EO94_09915 [Methanosarcina sp. 2.H.T.1A.3]KKG19406.1 hypothetical protein EO98_19315 [Methanosarcina sp. 2.H.T.1A.6]KKG25553.1 hypothetical protein EO96_18530 [Methanosarcina sp. 2.H.T.1A.8]
MKLDIIIRSFIIAVLISLIAVLLESAYYGLYTRTYSASNAAYSITSPFINNFSGISSPTNTAVIAIIFVSSFLIALNLIFKRERA